MKNKTEERKENKKISNIPLENLDVKATPSPQIQWKTAHEIWKEHYHNESVPQGGIPCKKCFLSEDDVKKLFEDLNCPDSNDCETIEDSWNMLVNHIETIKQKYLNGGKDEDWKI